MCLGRPSLLPGRSRLRLAPCEPRLWSIHFARRTTVATTTMTTTHINISSPFQLRGASASTCVELTLQLSRTRRPPVCTRRHTRRSSPRTEPGARTTECGNWCGGSRNQFKVSRRRHRAYHLPVASVSERAVRGGPADTPGTPDSPAWPRGRAVTVAT